MSETHIELNGWTKEQFPLEINQRTMAALNEILPEGYWLAKDLSAEEPHIFLLRHEVGDGS